MSIEFINRISNLEAQRAAMLEALREARPEITRLNKAAGMTVFNPAATQLIDAAIAKAEAN